MSRTETIDALFRFLEENHPGFEEAMVCKRTFIFEKDERTDWFLVEKHKAAMGKPLYIINGHLWHDYGFKFDSDNPWSVVWKSVDRWEDKVDNPFDEI